MGEDKLTLEQVKEWIRILRECKENAELEAFIDRETKYEQRVAGKARIRHYHSVTRGHGGTGEHIDAHRVLSHARLRAYVKWKKANGKT